MKSIENVGQQNALRPQCPRPLAEHHGRTDTTRALAARHPNRLGSADGLDGTDKLTQYDQHLLLISVAEEIEIDWPSFFDWKPIITTKEVSLALALIAALVVFAILCWGGLG